MDYNPFNERQAGKVPLWLIQDQKISWSAKGVYALLTMYAGKNGHCFPKLETLAENSGLSLRRVRELIRELETNGVLIVEKSKPKKLVFSFTIPASSRTEKCEVSHKKGEFSHKAPQESASSRSPYIEDENIQVLTHSYEGAREREEQKVTTTATFRNPDGSVLKEVGEKMR